MQCENSDDCPVRENPEKPCWETAHKFENFRKANNICRDCIVYVLKVESSVLSKQEIQKIMEKKTSCKLAPRCPRLAA
jgi:hypothetical protein